MTISNTYDLIESTFGEVVAKHGMEVCYVFVEDQALKLTDVALIDSCQVFEDPEDGFREFERLVKSRQITMYIPNSTGNKKVAVLESFRPGYFPWNDEDKVTYIVLEKGDIVIRRNDVE